MAAQSQAAKKWQEFPALEATRRMNSINAPMGEGSGLASSQIAFAAAMADMMRAKDAPEPRKKAPTITAPAAFDKDMLARLAQQAAEDPQEEEEPQPPAEPAAPAFQLPPGFSLVSFETEEEAAQALQEMEEEEPPPPSYSQPSVANASSAALPRSEQNDPFGAATKPASSSAAMGPARGWGRGEFEVVRGEPPDPFKKTSQVKSIVDNVLGKWQATAASSAAAAAVAPAPKAPPPARATATSEVPSSNDIYLPASGSAPPGGPASAGESRAEDRKEDAAFAAMRRRRGMSRSRPRSPADRRRSGSRRRGRSGDRGGRRKRSRSGSRGRRSRSRKGRGSAFGSSAADSTKPGAAAAPSESKNKFSDTANVQLQTKDVPDWLQDLAQPQINRAMLGRKVLRMPDAYIKCLIGRGGETIRNIINKTGADIRIEAKHDGLDGIVSIANNIEAAEKLIKEVLASKGCHWSTEKATDMGGELTNVGWKGHVDNDDLQIPTELVGLFIGNAGAGIKEIKARVGGAVTIKVLPPLLPGGFQVVQVVGENWKAAREVVRTKIKMILQETPGRWHAPGFGTNNPNLGGAGGSGGGAAHAGYMPGFGATPGMSYSREAHREGGTTNVVQGGTSI